MNTLINLFEESVIKFPDNVYLWQKTGDEYQGTTYKETRKQVHEFAAGLMKIGLQPGDRVTLLSEGRNEWAISELGVLYNGAVNVPLSVKLNEPDEIAFRLKHSGSRLAIVSGRQMQKIHSIWKLLPELELIISLDKTGIKDPRIHYFEDIAETGKIFLESNAGDFEKRYSSVTDNDYANICYTSGTTADPRPGG